MRKRRKLIAVSDLYRRIPKVLSAAAGSAAPPAQSLSISAAPAGTGTEVATREQLSSVVQDKFCPTLFPQADFTVPPVFAMEEECSLFDPFNLIFEGICDQLLSIHSTAPIPQLTPFSNVEEVLELSVQSMLDNYDPSLEAFQRFHLDLSTWGVNSESFHFFIQNIL